MILNLTQHVVTAEQKAQLVVEPRMTKDKIRELLTFEEIPSKEEIESRAEKLARIAVSEANHYAGETDNEIWITRVMLGGAPFIRRGRGRRRLPGRRPRGHSRGRPSRC